MELGEKLRQARLQAGLSQRQLCGEEITRNMLSQIENGSARPSMTTLQYLSRRLGLPVSYFLGEEGTVSSNSGCMKEAWDAFEAGEFRYALSRLEDYRSPDPLLDRQHMLLKALTLLKEAEQAAASGRELYARRLLQQAEELEPHMQWLPELRQRRIMLMGGLGDPIPEDQLPQLDEALMLHAASAMAAGRPGRAEALLDAAADHSSAKWCLLRGKAAMARKEYAAAARYLLDAEAAFPAQVIPLLESCFRELEDYKTAYFYACKARKL